MKVLVVDDSAVMRKILIKTLKNAGYPDVTEAEDGEKAVALVEKDDFGLVMMDWNMPNMLGIDALKAIRGMGKKMPVIMVTTEGEKDRVVEAVREGANNYVIKPFRAEVVVNKVEATLKKVGAID